MNTAEQETPPSKPPKPAFDAVARRAAAGCVVGLVLVIAFAAYGAIAGPGWLVFIAIIALLVSIGVAADLMRSKNIAWRALRSRFGTGFDAELDRKSFGTGRALLGGFSYFGVRCFGAPGGLEISRIVSRVNLPINVPWSAVDKIDTYPNLLTGRQGFETDMQARITLRDDREFQMEVPWLTEYRQLLPRSVKFRSIKLSKK
ncbi:MAG: hypothetical protein ACR2QV_04830 [Gammaproteobacteria bacterium]